MLNKKRYKLKIINNWTDFLDWSIYQDKLKGTWIYRGENNPDHLQTSIEKNSIKKFGHDIEKLPEFEKRLLNEFMRRLHHYRNDVPVGSDRIEWLAMMQHYGAPTRLLDWSYSPFVASYFACEQSEKEFVLWAIDRTPYEIISAIKKIGENKIRKYYKKNHKNNLPEFYENSYIWQITVFDYVLEHAIPGVYAINPFRLNERLTIQQGTFLCPGDLSKSFEDNLNAHKYSDDKLTKIIITDFDENKRKDFYYQLYRMNINRATLFPGLVGFAESLQTRLAFPEKLSFMSKK